MAARDEEVILSLPSPRSSVPRASSVRSTWLASSIRGLRERGHLDRYFELLPTEHHDAVRQTAAGLWLPIDVAMAHYEAAERLELPANEILELGVDATRAAHGGIVNILRTLAGGAGATPFSLLAQLHRVWERSWIGAAVGTTKIGPKEARIEIVQFPCSAYRHCRIGIRGVAIGMAEIFCKKAYAQELPELCTPLSLGLKLQWI